MKKTFENCGEKLIDALMSCDIYISEPQIQSICGDSYLENKELVDELCERGWLEKTDDEIPGFKLKVNKENVKFRVPTNENIAKILSACHTDAAFLIEKALKNPGITESSLLSSYSVLNDTGKKTLAKLLENEVVYQYGDKIFLWVDDTTANLLQFLFMSVARDELSANDEEAVYDLIDCHRAEQ